jgi:hypothetical protein
MHTAVDDFIDNMHSKLSRDIIEYIVKRYIFLPNNIYIIRRQKIAKYLMHLQMLFISNIIYIDDNYCIYIHDHDIIIYNIRQRTSNTSNNVSQGHTNLAEFDDNTSNIVIHTNHNDMENIIFYVIYSLDEGHGSQV